MLAAQRSGSGRRPFPGFASAIVALALASACKAPREAVKPPLRKPFLESSALRDHVLVRMDSEVRAAVKAACPSDLDFSIEGAGRVDLAFGVAAAPDPSTARFRALLRTVDGQETVALDETRTVAAAEETRWFSREVALPRGARTLRLETRGTSRTAFWGRPAFSQRGATPARNVIVVSLDTVRADHLGAYGYARRPTSPELDAWARQGALFLNAMGPAPGTLSSQMALLTGRYPSNHGVTYANWRLTGRMPVLAPDIPTLAEALGRQGLLTAAFTGAGYFALPAGYSRGFTEFVSSDDDTLGGVATVFGKALPWIEKHQGDPFFLFLHTYEAHEPYLDDRFARPEGLGRKDWKARNEALYDGDIRRADEYVGKLRRRLEELSLTGRTLVVIVADHGEEFGDHFDVWSDGHGHSLYDEQVHVPFVVVGPEVPRGLRLAEAVDLTAVVPTVLSFLGAPPLATDGRDLRRLLRGERDEGEGLAFSEDVWIGPRTWAARSTAWKLIVQGDDLAEFFLDNARRRAIRAAVDHLEREMLFHLPSDARERDNRLVQDASSASRLRDRLRAHVAALSRPGAEPSRGQIAVEGEVVERLRALGYMK